MADLALLGPEGSNLVNKFPPFTSISVVDNIYATLWAAIVQDVESLVEEFILCEEWDYAAYKNIAGRRDIVLLHRSAFSVFTHERHFVVHGDGSTRGRHVEQLQAYRRIISIILHAAKDVWLEPQMPLPSRNNLMDLKRSIAGLYTLYYLWHNQIPIDQYKIPIRYSPHDQNRAREVGENFLSLEQQIPSATVVKNCYKYVITALSKRRAFCYSYIVDEPKLEFFHWQQLHLKNCFMRKTLTSINSANRFSEGILEMQRLCTFLTDILKESSYIGSIPANRSVFFRKMLPTMVAKNAIELDTNLSNPSIRLPFNCVKIAEEISQTICTSAALIERRFLTLDSILQTDRAPIKIQGMGLKGAKMTQKRYEYNKKEYEKHKALFNKRCEEQHVPTLKVAKTRKYRSMTTPAWFFICKNFQNIFKNSSMQLDDIVQNESGIISEPQIVNVSSEKTTVPVQNGIMTGESSVIQSQSELCLTKSTKHAPGVRISTRAKRKSVKCSYEEKPAKRSRVKAINVQPTKSS